MAKARSKNTDIDVELTHYEAGIWETVCEAYGEAPPASYWLLYDEETDRAELSLSVTTRNVDWFALVTQSMADVFGEPELALKLVTLVAKKVAA